MQIQSPICINISTNIRLNLEWENKDLFWICAKIFLNITWFKCLFWIFLIITWFKCLFWIFSIITWFKCLCRCFSTRKQWSFIVGMVNYFSQMFSSPLFQFGQNILLHLTLEETYWMIQNHLELIQTERSLSIFMFYHGTTSWGFYKLQTIVNQKPEELERCLIPI